MTDTPPSSENSTTEPKPQHDPETEKHRAVPRSAWWILGIAVALVATFLVVRPHWFTNSAEAAPLQVPAERHFSQPLTGDGGGDGVWLTNDAPTTSALITLPVDTPRDRTRLKLTGSSQVAEDSTVFLMVSMDGQQVFERELPRGDHPLDETIAIPDRLAADGQVRVLVRTRGLLAHQTCTPDQSPGMVIHLDTDTVVESALDDPVHTVRDAVAVLGRDVTLVVADAGADWLSTATAVGLALTRTGYTVTYTDTVPDNPAAVILIGPEQALSDQTGWSDGESTDEAGGTAASGSIRVGTIDSTPVLAIVGAQPDVVAEFLSTTIVRTGDSAATGPQALATTPLSGNEVNLAALGVDQGQSQIIDSRSWRIPYTLADLPGGRLPRAVRVDIVLPDSPEDVNWLLNVTLNGQLIDSSRLPRPAGPVEIVLPAAAQLSTNQLGVSVQRDRDLGGCDMRPTPYPIQLLPTSALILGDEPGAGFTALPAAFAPGVEFYVTDADPMKALNAAVPVLAEFTGANTYPPVRTGQAPPVGAPFVVAGPTDGLASTLRLQDGRLLAGDRPVLDVNAAAGGAIVQCANAPGAPPALAVTPLGDPTATGPQTFGRDCAEVIMSAGSVTITATGEVVATPTRPVAPR
ncbi:MAG TPA: hypothetical protein VIW24_29865 [Aldersonia sp.]